MSSSSLRAPHTRRVRSSLVQTRGTEIRLRPWRQRAEDPFDRDHWWRNTRDAYAVVREIMGLINAWAGLTVRPHSPSIWRRPSL